MSLKNKAAQILKPIRVKTQPTNKTKCIFFGSERSTHHLWNISHLNLTLPKKQLKQSIHPFFFFLRLKTHFMPKPELIRSVNTIFINFANSVNEPWCLKFLFWNQIAKFKDHVLAQSQAIHDSNEFLAFWKQKFIQCKLKIFLFWISYNS